VEKNTRSTLTSSQVGDHWQIVWHSCTSSTRRIGRPGLSGFKFLSNQPERASDSLIVGAQLLRRAKTGANILNIATTRFSRASYSARSAWRAARFD
jgi:hypothetical protein